MIANGVPITFCKIGLDFVLYIAIMYWLTDTL